MDQILAGLTQKGPQKWLVDGLLPQGAFTVLYGAPKSGKTTFLAHLCGAVVGERTFLGRVVQPGPILWLDFEQPPDLTVEVLCEAGASKQAHEIHVYNDEPPNSQRLQATIAALSPIAIVVDSLSRFLELKDENDASEMTKQLTPLLRLVRQTGASLLAIHHDRKREGMLGKNMRGSSALPAMADLTLELREDAGDPTHRILHFRTRYRGLPERLGLRLTDTGYEQCAGPKYLRDSDLLATLAEKSMTMRELADQFEMTRQGIANLVGPLVASGQVIRLGTGRRGDPHRFSVSTDSASRSVPQTSFGIADSIDAPKTGLTTDPVDDGDF